MAIQHEEIVRPLLEEVLKAQSECQLLQLPAEVRNRIYELVLFTDQDIVEVRKTYKTPPILTTCHQIHTEAGGLYYGTAVFSVKAERDSGHQFEHRSISDLCSLWLTTRAFEASKHVRRVRLDLSYAGSSEWMNVWKPIALQIVRARIVSLKLGESIVVDAIGGNISGSFY